MKYHASRGGHGQEDSRSAQPGREIERRREGVRKMDPTHAIHGNSTAQLLTRKVSRIEMNLKPLQIVLEEITEIVNQKVSLMEIEITEIDIKNQTLSLMQLSKVKACWT